MVRGPAGTVVPSMLRLARRLFWTDQAPLPLPWFRILSRKVPVNRLHLAVFAYNWRSYRLGRVHLITRTLAWPLVSSVLIAVAFAKSGSLVKRRYGVGFLRQIWQQFVLANCYNLPPDAYYHYGLFRRRAVSDGRSLLVEQVKSKLLGQLNERLDGADLDDKLRFFRRCTGRRLPVIPILAVIRDGGMVATSGCSEPPLRTDLFVKPARSSGGSGAESWRFSDVEGAWHNGRERLSESALLAHFRACGTHRVLLVQPRLRNHAALAHLSRGGLCTVRVLTYRFPDAEPLVLNAAVRMPRGRSHVDNVAAGGIAAAVDVHTGRLGNAFAKSLAAGEVSRHPDTGAPIAGSVVPCWREVMDLCVRAHGEFRQHAFLGWDVAVTAEGPVIVEGNTNTCAWLAQVPQGQYLGDTTFVDCFLAHLERKG